MSCANCICSGHNANNCYNKTKYWVGTQDPGDSRMERNYVTAKRSFIAILNSTPTEIPSGTQFWQNPFTKQVIYQRFLYPDSGLLDCNKTQKCLTCGSNNLFEKPCTSGKCQNKHKFWLATQDTTNAKLKTARRDFIIIYSGHPIEIKQRTQFYQNPLTKQVIVGWHGSVMPPCDMDCMPLRIYFKDFP